MVFRRVCLAVGSIAFLCTGCISLVSLWLLPFMRSTSTLPIIILTLTIIATDYVWHLRTLGRPWAVPVWILLLEYGSVAIAAAIISLRRVRGSAALQRAGEQVK
jgi:hypothetical protein